MIEQLDQQLQLQKSAPEQPLIDALGNPAHHVQQLPLLGFYPDNKQQQSLGLLRQVMKEKLGNG